MTSAEALAEDRRRAPAIRPLGVKLELTHACNLRCDFCYTDSPRRTLALPQELDHDQWLRVGREAIELGALEASLTGGEALLRPELVLDLVELLEAEGLAVSLNTNGWFLTEELARTLAGSRALTVHISIDGPTPDVHDPSRGVPGSWRRAVVALDRLLRHAVPATVVHVVTPWNEASFPQTLELLWRLGVTRVRVTPVFPAGAAAVEKGWGVDERRVAATVASAVTRHGEDFLVSVAESHQLVPDAEGNAGPALMVRPTGAVVMEAAKPFRVGDVRQEPLAEAWRRLLERWDDPEVREWEGAIRDAEAFAAAPVTPYRDPDVALDGRPPEAPRARGDLERALKRQTSTRDAAPAVGDLAGAQQFVDDLVLARAWRVAPHRWAGAEDGPRLVRVLADGTTLKLSAAASSLLEELDGVPLRTAIARAGHGLDAATAFAIVRGFVAAGLVAPVAAAR